MSLGEVFSLPWLRRFLINSTFVDFCRHLYLKPFDLIPQSGHSQLILKIHLATLLCARHHPNAEQILPLRGTDMILALTNLEI